MAKTYRYNLNLSEELFKEVKIVANGKQITVVELLRRFIKLGLLVTNLQEDSEIIIKQGDKVKQIIFL